MNKSLLAALVFVSILAALHLVGFFFPDSLDWGFHTLGFLTPADCIAYLIIAILAVVYVIKGNPEVAAEKLANFMERRPLLFLCGVIALYAGLAFLLQVKIPLLGDSFLVINNYRNTIAGAHPFHTYLEPVAFLYFFELARLLGTFHYPEMMRAFLFGDVLLAVGVIASTFYTVRYLLDTPRSRLFVFVLALSLPTWQLFFGYVESYAAVVFSLSLYTLVVALYLKDKLSFALVFMIFIAQIIVHFLNIILIPSIIYLACCEYKQRGLKHILAGAGGAAALIGLLLFVLQFDVGRFLPRSERHFLSLSALPNSTPAYGLFSLFHLSDLVNLLIILGPSVFYLYAISYAQDRKGIFDSPVSRFFMLSLLPFIGFVLVAKFDLGMPKDWDISATYMVMISLGAGYIYVRRERAESARILTLLIAVTALNSLAFARLNSTIDPGIKRFKTLVDRRTIGRDNHYLMLQHLSEYYFYMKDMTSLNELWEEYIGVYPGDWRGYQSLVKSLTLLGDIRDNRIPTTFEEWKKVDPDSTRVNNEYASYSINLGLQFFGAGRYGDAIDQYQKALRLNPTLADAYNNLGILYDHLGNAQAAMQMYRQGILLDSNSTKACINLANAYDDTGHPDSAMIFYQKALDIDPRNVDAYENIGIAYLKRGDRKDAIVALKHAAQLGSRDAQQFLKENGESW